MAIYAKVGSSGEIVRKMQTIHGLSVNGTFDESLASKVRGLQVQEGLSVNGYVDDATLRMYQRKWPYLFTGYTPVALGGGGFGGGGAGIDSSLLDKVIGGILLYGIFRVLMKVF